GLAEEELQRVGRRLVRRLERGRRRLLLFLLLLDDLDSAAVELVVERVRLERVELVQLDQLGQLELADRARHFCVLQQSLDVLVLEDRLDLYGHLPTGSCLSAGSPKRARSQARHRQSTPELPVVLTALLTKDRK